MLKPTIILAAAIGFVGCSRPAPPPPAPSKVEYKPPVVHTVAGGQIIDFNVPGEAWHDSQKCYVYRDLEFKTSSISCPADRLGAIKLDGPPD